jgi:hypothetical protein
MRGVDVCEGRIGGQRIVKSVIVRSSLPTSVKLSEEMEWRSGEALYRAESPARLTAQPRPDLSRRKHSDCAASACRASQAGGRVRVKPRSVV